MTNWDIFSYIVAAACHDIEHPGLNNVFLVAKKDKLANRYNDISVLENHHAATAFDILSQEEFNILSHLSTAEYK